MFIFHKRSVTKNSGAPQSIHRIGTWKPDGSMIAKTVEYSSDMATITNINALMTTTRRLVALSS